MKRAICLMLSLLLALTCLCAQGTSSYGEHTHKWVSTGDRQEPTCTETGIAYEYCSICQEFRERTLDQYGPLSYEVLTEWGVKSTEDVGEMMMNMAESHRVGRDEDDTPESFVGGYDFKEAFLGPFKA